VSDELLQAAAAALGAPLEMVLRSAQARAAAEGTTVESVLEAWAGGARAPTSPQEPPPESPASPEREAESVVAPAAAVMEAPIEPTPAAPLPAPRREAEIPTQPETIPIGRADDFEVVTTVATASIKERTRAPVPRWLGSLFVALPLIAVLLLLQSGSPECGQAGSLGVDPVSGEIVNCDGSEFTGSGPGGEGGANFLAVGRAIFTGQGTCFACHGSQGEGQGTFPALTGVTRTFSACSDHIRWVTLGSEGWRSQVGPTYGDEEKPVNGGMPTFGATLSEEQIRSVALFERVQFGRADLDTTLVDCGLVEEEPPPGQDETEEESGEGPDA